MSETTELTKVSNELSEVWHLGKLLSSSGFFADATKAAQAAVKVLAGQELGIPPVAAMMGINIIKGKVALSGNLIASRIRAHGYDFRVKRLDSTGCVLVFLGKPGTNGKRAELGESPFTESEAKTAGVYSDMYRKFPRNMYFNRAVSNGAKWYTPEVSAGMPMYVPEELGVEVDGDGNMQGLQPTTETREELVQRRIAEVKASPRVNEVDALVQEMEQPPLTDYTPKPPPEPNPAAAVEVPKELAEIWGRMTSFASSVKEMQKLKSDIEGTAGTDLPYYAKLLEHGMKHANDLKGKKRSEVRLVARDLWLLVQKLKEEPPADEIPEDLQAAIDGTKGEGEDV